MIPIDLFGGESNIGYRYIHSRQSFLFRNLIIIHTVVRNQSFDNEYINIITIIIPVSFKCHNPN